MNLQQERSQPHAQQSMGALTVPSGALGLVLMEQGQERVGFDEHGQEVTAVLHSHHLATLLVTLLTDVERQDPALAEDVELLAERWEAVLDWVMERAELSSLRLGLFGNSLGAAAALRVAARRRNLINAVVSRSGRPDLLGDELSQVGAPTLLVVGSDDPASLEPNRQALHRLTCRRRLEVVPGASRLYDTDGAHEVVSQLAASWFETHLMKDARLW